jgi:hypothetical protein
MLHLAMFEPRSNVSIERPWTRYLFNDPWSTSAYKVIVALSVAIRLVALFAVRNVPLASDAQDYCHMARQLLSGQPFVPYWPPGTSIYLIPFVAARAPDVVLRFAMLPFWLICCWGLYRLMSAMGTHGIAWLVLLVFSLLPDSIHLSIEPLTSMPVAALLIVALSSVVKALQGAQLSEYLLMGCSWGFISLIRPSSLPLVVLLPIACFLVTRRFHLALISVVFGMFLVCCWMFHAHTLTGKWIINTANAKNMYYGNNPWTPLYRTWYFGSHAKPGTEEIKNFPEFERVMKRIDDLPALDQPAAFQLLTTSYIRSHPGQFLVRSSNRVRCFFGFDIFTAAALKNTRWMGVHLFPLVLVWEALVYFLLVATSLFWMAQAQGSFWREPANSIILATVVIYSAPYWLSMSHPTYHYPILLPLAVLGASAWKMSAHQSRHRLRGWIAIVALLLVQVEWVWQMSQATVAS